MEQTKEETQSTSSAETDDETASISAAETNKEELSQTDVDVYEAYASAEKTCKLGHRYKPMRQYTTTFYHAVMAKYPERGPELRRELFTLKDTKTSATLKIANNALLAKDYRTALDNYCTAAARYQHMGGLNGGNGIIDCCVSISKLSQDIKQSREKLKPFADQYVFPFIRMMINKMKEVEDLEEDDLVYGQSICVWCIAFLHYYLEEYRKTEQACMEGMRMIEMQFPLTYMKKQYYAHFSIYLSHAYAKMHGKTRQLDSLKYYNQARECFQLCDEYDNEYERADMLNAYPKANVEVRISR